MVIHPVSVTYDKGTPKVKNQHMGRPTAWRGETGNWSQQRDESLQNKTCVINLVQVLFKRAYVRFEKSVNQRGVSCRVCACLFNGKQGKIQICLLPKSMSARLTGGTLHPGLSVRW